MCFINFLELSNAPDQTNNIATIAINLPQMQQSKTGKTHICELLIEVMVALALLEPWPYWNPGLLEARELLEPWIHRQHHYIPDHLFHPFLGVIKCLKKFTPQIKQTTQLQWQ
jgi:hypothetical protein